jgi:hypothetical protein
MEPIFAKTRSQKRSSATSLSWRNTRQSDSGKLAFICLPDMLDRFSVGRMVDPVTDRNLRDVERIDALKAADVVRELPGVGTSLVMSVNAADSAKIMPGGMRVELVNPEMLGAFDDMKPALRHKRYDGASTPTVRAVAASRVDDAIREVQQQLDSATVADGAMLALNNRVTNFFEAHFQAPKI